MTLKCFRAGNGEASLLPTACPLGSVGISHSVQSSRRCGGGKLENILPPAPTQAGQNGDNERKTSCCRCDIKTGATGTNSMNTSESQSNKKKSHERSELLQPALLMGLVKAWFTGSSKGADKMSDNMLNQGLQLRLYSRVRRNYFFIRCNACNQWEERKAGNTYDHAEIGDIEKAIDAGCRVQVMFSNKPVAVWTSWNEFIAPMTSGTPTNP